MQVTSTYKKAIDSYHATLADLRGKGGVNELHLRPAFQNLLATVSKKVGWTLVPEQALPNGRVPDGTLRDEFLLPRGYWEAKDTADELEVEIKQKIKDRYPLTNIIFEDTLRAVLYQDGQRKLEVDLTRIQEVAELLQTFTTHAAAGYRTIRAGGGGIQSAYPRAGTRRIGDHRKGAPTSNKRFVAAFGTFHESRETALIRASVRPRSTRCSFSTC